MKNAIIAIAIVLMVGYFLYSQCKTPDITFTIDEKNLQLSSDSFKYVFEIHDPFEVDGYVMGADHQNDGPFSVFSSTCGIVWGDTAIELASATPNQLKDISSFSQEAQEVIRQYGCPANYLNNHVVSCVITTENEILDKAMRSLKKEDRIRLSGFKLRLQSAEFEGMLVNFSEINALCVTEAVINGDHYGDSNQLSR